MQQYSSLILPAAVLVAFYFLLIRPQQQQAKKQQEMLGMLRPGVEIMTIGGIYATVVSVDEDRVRVAVADGSELEIAKRAVNAVIEREDHEADAQSDDLGGPPMQDADPLADPDAER